MEKQKRKRTETTSASSVSENNQVTNWFQQDLTRRSATKRIGKGMAWAAGLGMVGLTAYQIFSDDDSEVSEDSLKLQQTQGWNIGATDRKLNFDPTFTSATASVADADWKQYLDPNKLIAAYQPKSSTWQPYFVPTLIQSLAQPTLREQIKPVKTPLMEQTYDQATALKELLSQSANANESLLVSDMDGIHSVALGAALADFAHIVPDFDNWPHPLGVVRSHETLGAMVYYAKEIEDKKAKVGDKAPAVMLLDNQRLNAYTDEENQFDNRYLAKIPSANDLKQRGITSLLYVVKDDKRKEEMDDLNDEFVELEKQGISTRFLRLSEFKPATDTVAAGTTPTTTTGTNSTVRHNYYYGGSPLYHWWFYNHYFYSPYPYAYTTYGGARYNYARPTTPPPFTPPAYRPVSRPTMFSGTRVGGASGVGRNRPSGFGRTSVRMSSSGQITGVRSGRSGSYGRSGGGWFGG
ncbi:MAG TPA: hypothetical protein VFZ34_09035 [Blastocatellia bacterium]|nr:hypothetical protein [Blastocatellia bacterium]